VTTGSEKLSLYLSWDVIEMWFIISDGLETANPMSHKHALVLNRCLFVKYIITESLASLADRQCGNCDRAARAIRNENSTSWLGKGESDLTHRTTWTRSRSLNLGAWEA
jgi:hypothetical protein